MAPSYKDHPIPELKGAELSGDDGSTYMRPTHAVYKKWLTLTRKVLRALGAFWMIPMTPCLEFIMGVYMPLVDGVWDDGDDPIFQYIVVSLAIGHGALQSLPAPENVLLDVDQRLRRQGSQLQTCRVVRARPETRTAAAARRRTRLFRPRR
eukprot:911309-Rhodomonas_salina.2